MTETEVLAHISDRLRTLFDVKRMVLFGSRATGAAGPDSDYDVLVVTETDIPFVRRQGIALKSLGKRDFPLDLLVYTPEELAREGAILGSVIYWAEQEGKEYVA